LKFYQNAKTLIQNSSEDYKDTDQLLSQYFENCRDKNIYAPMPLFLKMFKNNRLVIKDIGINKQHCESIAALIQQALQNGNGQFEVRSLLIDDTSMDDEKTSIILAAMEHQPNLRQLSLSNCKMSSNGSVKILKTLLEKQDPNNIEEFRIRNIKFLNNADESCLDQIIQKLAEQK
jgi:Ran GTPase-activating protein (RanGAP) involved in mRNA processing and transport